MTSFNEGNVNRDNDGKFAAKTTGESDIDIQDAPPSARFSDEQLESMQATRSEVDEHYEYGGTIERHGSFVEWRDASGGLSRGRGDGSTRGKPSVFDGQMRPITWSYGPNITHEDKQIGDFREVTDHVRYASAPTEIVYSRHDTINREGRIVASRMMDGQGRLHNPSDEGPALTSEDEGVAYMFQGRPHRPVESGPAVVYPNGEVVYYDQDVSAYPLDPSDEQMDRHGIERVPGEQGRYQIRGNDGETNGVGERWKHSRAFDDYYSQVDMGGDITRR